MLIQITYTAGGIDNKLTTVIVLFVLVLAAVIATACHFIWKYHFCKHEKRLKVHNKLTGENYERCANCFTKILN